MFCRVLNMSLIHMVFFLNFQQVMTKKTVIWTYFEIISVIISDLKDFKVILHTVLKTYQNLKPLSLY